GSRFRGHRLELGRGLVDRQGLNALLIDRALRAAPFSDAARIVACPHVESRRGRRRFVGGAECTRSEGPDGCSCSARSVTKAPRSGSTPTTSFGTSSSRL